MTSVICWWWQNGRRPGVFKPEHVHALKKMVETHLSIPHRFVCITDKPDELDCETFPLWSFPEFNWSDDCWRRIKIFDPEINTQFGDRIISIDLDVLIEGDFAHLIENIDFQCMKGDASPLNTSFFTLKTGTMSHIWEQFSGKAVNVVKRSGYKGSDQAWLSVMAEKPSMWTEKDGVSTYRRLKVRPSERIVTAFPGTIKPWCNADNHKLYRELEASYRTYLE